MPRHDWYDDDTMSRDRRDERGHSGDYRSHELGRRERGRSRNAMFDSDRGDRGRPIGGWGGLMGDESSGSRGRRREFSRDRDMGYGPDDHHRGIPMDETERLIASNKVEGTPVYDRHGDRLGTVHNFMVDKFEGEVVYAVLRHGGFLGLGERYYPLEWCDLSYDTRLGGFRVSFEEEDLESFGSFDSQGEWHRRRSGGIRFDRDFRSQRGGRGFGHDRDFERERGSRGFERERGNRYSPW